MLKQKPNINCFVNDLRNCNFNPGFMSWDLATVMKQEVRPVSHVWLLYHLLYQTHQNYCVRMLLWKCFQWLYSLYWINGCSFFIWNTAIDGIFTFFYSSMAVSSKICIQNIIMCNVISVQFFCAVDNADHFCSVSLQCPLFLSICSVCLCCCNVCWRSQVRLQYPNIVWMSYVVCIQVLHKNCPLQ